MQVIDLLHFDCDYMEGAHPNILQRLMDTNLEQTPGYGSDSYSAAAKEKIRAACHCPEAEIHFLVGGTQANATVIGSLLAPYQGVLAAGTGHIATHESGAIEAGGHKVLPLPQMDGKISASDLEHWVTRFYQDENWEHMVAPGMVYLSHPTEYGTLYTRAELEAIHQICQQYKLHLFLDGARLGYGLMADGTDVTLETLAQLCDVFYIGGTKVGALFGEAVVFPKPNLIPHFFSLIKQHGALLAKGRLLGLQFDTLFTDNLYFRISRHAIEMAQRLKAAFQAKGYPFYLETDTNQQFIILDPHQKEALAPHVSWSFWENLDDGRTVVRFATSWATRSEDIDALAALL